MAAGERGPAAGAGAPAGARARRPASNRARHVARRRRPHAAARRSSAFRVRRARKRAAVRSDSSSAHRASPTSCRATACCTWSASLGQDDPAPRRSCPPTPDGRRRSRWRPRSTRRRRAIAAVRRMASGRSIWTARRSRSSWKTNGGGIVGAIAFTADGTLLAAIGPGQASGDGKANAIVALDPTLQVKDWYRSVRGVRDGSHRHPPEQQGSRRRDEGRPRPPAGRGIARRRESRNAALRVQADPRRGARRSARMRWRRGSNPAEAAPGSSCRLRAGRRPMAEARTVRCPPARW